MKGRAVKYFLAAAVLFFAVCSVVLLLCGQTASGLNNTYPLGLVLIGAQCIIAAGAGTFIVPFLYRIFRADGLKAAVTPSIAISLVSCIAAAFLMLIDLGQPIRAWYAIGRPNWGRGLIPVSRLTATLFALAIFTFLLCLEFAIICLTSPKRSSAGFTALYAKKFLWAATAASGFFAFFLQGYVASVPLHSEKTLFFFQGVFASAAAGPLFLSLNKSLKECRQALVFAGRTSMLLYFILRLTGIFLETDVYTLWDDVPFAALICTETALGIAAAAMVFKRKTIGAVLGLSFIAAGKSVSYIYDAVRLGYLPSLWEAGVFAGAFAAAFLLYRLLINIKGFAAENGAESNGISKDMPLQNHQNES